MDFNFAEARNLTLSFPPALAGACWIAGGGAWRHATVTEGKAGDKRAIQSCGGLVSLVKGTKQREWICNPDSVPPRAAMQNLPSQGLMMAAVRMCSGAAKARHLATILTFGGTRRPQHHRRRAIPRIPTRAPAALTSVEFRTRPTAPPLPRWAGPRRVYTQAVMRQKTAPRPQSCAG